MSRETSLTGLISTCMFFLGGGLVFLHNLTQSLQVFFNGPRIYLVCARVNALFHVGFLMKTVGFFLVVTFF